MQQASSEPFPVPGGDDSKWRQRRLGFGLRGALLLGRRMPAGLQGRGARQGPRGRPHCAVLVQPAGRCAGI
eukprot:9476860-Pyramimonas_sp.AAC.1